MRLSEERPVGAAQVARAIPLDAFPGVDGLAAGSVRLDGTVVGDSPQNASVAPDGFVRAGRSIIGRVHNGQAYRRTSRGTERHIGSVAEVRTRRHLLVYLYDSKASPIGFLLFGHDDVPRDDPALHLRLAGAALVCCQRAPTSCAGSVRSPHRMSAAGRLVHDSSSRNQG